MSPSGEPFSLTCMGVMTVRVSEHAIDRYIERIAPGMVDNRGAVRELVVRLVRTECHTRKYPPEWVNLYDNAPSETVGATHWAVLVNMGIAFPLRGGWVLTTLTRAGVSSEARERRNEKRARRTKRARHHRRSQYSHIKTPMGTRPGDSPFS